MTNAPPIEYEPTWESLQRYTVPQWFMDDKFGIFIHWGVYAVPAFGNEWYPCAMYNRDDPAYEHHIKAWGPHKKFGYKDFVPMFRAERWDPAAWVELFKQSGAKYVVPVAEHHDGFPMYDCQYTDWNAAKMGPRRDTVAELEKIVRAEGLKFGVSSHRAHNWRFYTFDDEFDTVDPAGIGLYGPAHDKDEPASPQFLEDWFARTKELVDKFHPDVLWFDFGWHQDEFEPYRSQVTAYYYNQAQRWGGEAVLQYKDKFPDGVAVYDIERGKLDDIRPDYWQTDTAVSYKSWGYVEDDEFKSVTTVVHDLIDIVSKNGNLLLNIGPRPDGIIPDEAANVLRGVGDWLKVNGEAIYGTRPWQSYGEGTTNVGVGHHTERDNAAFTAEDIRFTTKENCLYAICLGQPDKPVAIRSLRASSSIAADQITSVTELASGQPLDWSQDTNALTIQPPAARGEHAVAFKITLRS